MGSAGNAPLNQSLLIPLGVTSPANAQQGLVFTVSTPTLASLPGLTSATGAGGVLKLPLPTAQAGSVLNAALQTAELQQTLQLPAAPQSLPTSTGPLEPPAEITSIKATQGLSLNPTIVIGPLPLLVNPANISITNMVTPAPAQSLQGQTVTPQMLLNAQGHVIANVISNQFVPVLNRQGGPLSPVETLQQVHTFQAIASVAPANVTPATSSALAKLPDTPSDITTRASVGQLVSKPRNATTEAEGINLEEIREFAKNFKIRRLSLGLTQTQVGQALSAAEGPTYSQSAICRFEKLDITPKSAQKIKPVLERWLTEAEVRHCVGVQDLTEFVGSEPSKKRKRRTSFTPQALETLNVHFERNTHPTGQEMTEIAEQLNYDREVVRVWFCNKRQNLKNTVRRLRHNDSMESGSAE